MVPTSRRASLNAPDTLSPAMRIPVHRGRSLRRARLLFLSEGLLGECPAGFPKPASQFLDESPGYFGIGGYERPEGGRGEDKAVRVLKSDYVGRPRLLIEEAHLPEELTSR